MSSFPTRKIRKILVANRGEIALRVMRSAREMGIKTVAVYSQADRLAPHVKAADQAVCVGAPPSSESYLRIEKIIEAAQQTGADAIHPGYGFLSENATFARAVEAAGLIFIGPSAEAIEVMGSKLAAKNAVSAYDIPMVPGTKGAVTDLLTAKKEAAQIGYPILIKASAGGGGKGMRIVETEADFEAQMQRAVSEAISAFGDGSVFIEKYITSPRHIEIQVLGDKLGNVVYLFERECSVQRRHQKVVEEAPSPVVSPQMRKAMGQAAVSVAKACNYYGAGTVEFVVDEKLNFYFLEMNTRLQVEHPVTEMITGVDLVKEQIRIAEGNALPFQQDDLKIEGHAMEVRVYAEDPANNFLPNIGKVEHYKIPQGIGVRVDDGFEAGMQVPIFYDPMIAKLITYAPTRQEAIERMVRAIDEYEISGIETTLPFCKFVMQHQAFQSGAFDTKFVERYFKPEYLSKGLEKEAQTELEKVAALVALMLFENPQEDSTAATLPQTAKGSNWKKRSWK
ncbi:acetyl-CoA carboxylase biotin carboxylase subunit [Hugenholtzia roseola]|uniref:acetyl-CoA carboxylase biotin carboxylase subunit n=1 Tax=Hugenholtzia roseola TaxID=1002 RepID=UPI0005595D8F|nr:acetyl-CoA carboxylase biotin carboxylase subunit [Hugenholtzia roseola]